MRKRHDEDAPSFYSVVYVPEDHSVAYVPEHRAEAYISSLETEGLSPILLGTVETDEEGDQLLRVAGIDTTDLLTT